MSDSTPKSYSTDPILYIYTSLTSGSSHIVTATSRLETILKANKIPFKAIDVATDEKARMLWGRRAGKDESGRQRKLPGLVQMGLVIGDLVEIEEWNEYGELKGNVKIVPIDGTPAPSAAPTPSGTPSKPPKSESKSAESKNPESTLSKAEASGEPSKEPSKPPAGAVPTSFTLAMRQAGEEAAQKAKDARKKAAEVFIGKGEAEPSRKEQDGTKSIPTPIKVHRETSTGDGLTEPKFLMQSPTSTAWKTPPATSPEAEKPSQLGGAFSGSMQSPKSTAWKPTDIDPPILSHRGSSISVASAEEIKEVERSQTIEEEEDEDDEEDEEDDDDDEDEDDGDDDEDEDDGDDDDEESVREEDKKKTVKE